jgi:pyrroline-5-carboxylate reductase
MTGSIGFIGTGHIAAPMARALAKGGHDVVVSERSETVAAALAGAFQTISVAPNQGVVDASDTVFLCLRPQMAESIVAGLRFRPGQRIVSVMAGIAAADLARWCAPATEISIMIPLGFLEAGGCPLAVYPNGAAITPLFGDKNPVVAVASEAALNSHFAICALVPGILAMLETGADWLAAKAGNPDDAALYTTQLVAGFLNAMGRQAGCLKAEKEALATSGTLSLMMVEGLAEGGANRALTSALDAIDARLNTV